MIVKFPAIALLVSIFITASDPYFGTELSWRPVPKVEKGDRVKIGRKGNRITIDVDADLAPRVEDAIRKLIGELLDRGQDGLE